MDFEIISNSPQQTSRLGRQFGSQLKGAEIVGLYGQLGSGKTHLIKAIVSAVSDDSQSNPVTSPTFVLVNEYSGRLDIYHIDAYRLESTEQFEQLGFDDFCYPSSVVLIEWADRIEQALADHIRIELSHISETSRKIRFCNLPAYITVLADNHEKHLS